MELLITLTLIVALLTVVVIVSMLVSFIVLALQDLIYFIKKAFTETSSDELSAEEEARIQATADELGIKRVTYCNGVRIVE